MDIFGRSFDLNGDGKIEAMEDAIGVATLLAALDDDGEERFDGDELCEDEDEDDLDEDERCEDDDEDDFDEEDV